MSTVAMAITPFVITTDLVAPITESINTGLTTLVPIGIGLSTVNRTIIIRLCS